jgi:hypothetical protein
MSPTGTGILYDLSEIFNWNAVVVVPVAAQEQDFIHDLVNNQGAFDPKFTTFGISLLYRTTHGRQYAVILVWPTDFEVLLVVVGTRTIPTYCVARQQIVQAIFGSVLLARTPVIVRCPYVIRLFHGLSLGGNKGE